MNSAAITKIRLFVLVIVMLISGFYMLNNVYQVNSGIDLFQNWGVSKSYQWSGAELKTLYKNWSSFHLVLDAFARVSSDWRVQDANNVIRQIFIPGIPPGTPLFFMFFEPMPHNYSLAFAVYGIISMLLFVSASALIFYGYPHNQLSLMIISLFITSAEYKPLFLNLVYGNFNCFQYFVFTAIAYVIRANMTDDLTPSFLNKKNAGIIVMCLLALMVLMKPNLIILACFLAMSVWALQGASLFALSGSVAVVFSAVLIVVSSIYFGSWTIWMDWLNCFSAGSESLFLPVGYGNYSTTLLLSKLLNTNIQTIMMVVGTGLVTSVLCCLFQRKSIANLCVMKIFNRFVVIIKNPFLSASIGVVATIALSPLVWFHYYVMLLLPALCFFNDFKSWGGKSGAVSAILLSSGIVTTEKVSRLFNISGLVIYEPYFVAIAWIPLWVCVLIKIRNSVSTESCH